MISLSLNDIADLLNDHSIRPKPRQAGPLRYNTKLLRDCSVCKTSCIITVNGKPYCTSHAIYALNEMLLGASVMEYCNCETGQKTMHSLHTSDCSCYTRLSD